ncbi:Transcription initiation factor IIE subunit alpha [Smittium culicis]|uniref:Transcription initiation factor IIE subunit alpha n=1 Tax=Smittium culicis TaxID=133412 RepID=A0A1R1XV26_9FUNG|nr:Transcription initiation factor IIE subunit alpha [Smittium culicis]OMJ23512.1 Transcription initiation factor IIE subunit alpha [Smittium culicis]OMJ26064.1 Transcription initiation factor IIE subunit alpha [Smittium culicis]
MSNESVAKVQLLVSIVARAFYADKYILALDYLNKKERAREDEISRFLQVPLKEVHKICGRLREEKLLRSQTRMESRKAEQKPISRTYYQLDYCLFVDVIKWRMWKLQQIVKSKMEVVKYSTLQAMSLVDFTTGLFKCEICSGPLDDNTNSESAIKSQEILSKLMDQCTPILNVLKQTDSLVLPQPLPFDLYQPPDIETDQYDKAIDSNYDASMNEDALNSSGGLGGGLAVSKDTGIKTGEILVEFDGDLTKEQELYNREQKALLKMKQNALPPWHVWSTVSDAIMVPESSINPEMIKLYLKRNTKSKSNVKNRAIYHNLYKNQILGNNGNISIELINNTDDFFCKYFTFKLPKNMDVGNSTGSGGSSADKEISNYYKELSNSLGIPKNKKRKFTNNSAGDAKSSGDGSSETTRFFDDLVNIKKSNTSSSKKSQTSNVDRDNINTNDSEAVNSNGPGSDDINNNRTDDSSAIVSNNSDNASKMLQSDENQKDRPQILKSLIEFLEKNQPSNKSIKVASDYYELKDITHAELQRMTNSEYNEFWQFINHTLASILSKNGVEIDDTNNRIGQMTFGVLDCIK